MITVIGETLVDLIEDPPGHPVAYPGGSPANVAVALAALGPAVRLLTQLSDDPLGRLLLAHLRDRNVELAPGTRLDSPRTSTARTSLSPDGQARYTFDIEWRGIDAPVGGWVDPTVHCVHTGSLATMLQPGADDVAAIVHAARETSMVSFDPNCRPSLVGDVEYARNRVENLVAASDITKASLEDLAWLYPGRSIVDVSRDWLDRGAKLVVITLGSEGARATTLHRDITVPAAAVEVVDTVGAGDAFTAGLLCALERAGLLGVAHREALATIDDATLHEVLTFAVGIAVQACGRRGANPPLPPIPVFAP